MGITLARRFPTRLLTVGALLAAGLAGCGNGDLYSYNAPAAVLAADFTGSGYPAIAVAQAQIDQLNTEESPGYVAVILQNPNSPGTFESSLHFGTQGNPSAMAVGALTPGTLDLAVANVNDQSVSVLMQTAPHASTFATAVNLSVAPSGAAAAGDSYAPEDVAICDVNNDGNPDIVVGYVLQQTIDGLLTSVGGGVSALLQNASSPGTFNPVTLLASAPTNAADPYPDTANSVHGIACANLSGDTSAAPDIVMTSYLYYDQSGDYGTLSILFHDPSNPGSFLPRVDISLPGDLHRVRIADVNGDGLPDIIVTDEGEDENGQGASGIEVLLQNPPATPGAQPTFAAPVYYATNSPLDVAIGDVNGDGLPDLVVVSDEPEGLGSANVLLNTPGSPGTFQAPVQYTGLGSPVAIALGTFGNNSLLDIAIADGGGAAVFLNTPSDPGTFQAAQLVGG